MVIGAGTYRMNVEVNEHIESLKYAVDKGCRLIDTASNYQKGKSEKLVGEVKQLGDNIKIITKAGYLDHEDISMFKDVSFNINNQFYYSFHPSFIGYKIKKSLERFGSSSIDTFLIHNPEYLLPLFGKDVFYKMLKKSFEFLEVLVDEKIINNYGISSNTFATYDDPNHINIEKIVSIVNEISYQNNFKFIQFPYNLYERKASDKIYFNSQFNLFEFSNFHGIKTIINRPFTGNLNKKPVRIAIYDDIKKNELDADAYTKFINSIKNNRVKEIEQTEVFLFLRENWNNFKSEKLLSLFFEDKIISTLEKNHIDFSNDEINKSIDLFYDSCLNQIKKRISLYNQSIKKKICDKNPEFNEEETYATILCRLYAKEGADIILTGMRSKKYVDDLIPVLKSNV